VLSGHRQIIRRPTIESLPKIAEAKTAPAPAALLNALLKSNPATKNVQCFRGMRASLVVVLSLTGVVKKQG
jgi:hypothetical protein